MASGLAASTTGSGHHPPPDPSDLAERNCGVASSRWVSRLRLVAGRCSGITAPDCFGGAAPEPPTTFRQRWRAIRFRPAVAGSVGLLCPRSESSTDGLEFDPTAFHSPVCTAAFCLADIAKIPCLVRFTASNNLTVSSEIYGA
jgi:hypothetical protein